VEQQPNFCRLIFKCYWYASFHSRDGMLELCTVLDSFAISPVEYFTVEGKSVFCPTTISIANVINVFVTEGFPCAIQFFDF